MWKLFSSSFFLGASAVSEWLENGVTAYSAGAYNLIPNVVSYEFTWNLDGTLTGPPNQAKGLMLTLVGPSATPYTETTFYTSPSGPVSFVVQPTNPSDPFSFGFALYGIAQSSNPNVSSESADFYNTATLVSAKALDASGNVVPGIDLALSDGTLIGPTGFVSPQSSVTPEPSTFVLLATGILGIVQVVRRRVCGDLNVRDEI